ncbi:MAG TPA: hypothetical protein VGJ86_00110 [Acidimicrobiales bacterium]
MDAPARAPLLGPPVPTPATDRGVRPTVGLGELVILSAVGLVASVGTVSWYLAETGRHSGGAALWWGLVVMVLIGSVAYAFGGRIAIELDPWEVGLTVATLLAAAYFFLPGFTYGYGDKDPGIYVAHAYAIARDGDVAIPDPIAEVGLDNPLYQRRQPDGVRPAYHEPDAVTSQFFHFDSALRATVYDLFGGKSIWTATPVLAMLGVTTFVLAARRAAGTPVAVIAAALLVTSMIQVWQAKYPSTEITAQLCLSGALLAGVLAIDRAWAGGALIGGALVGVSFLVRPDGFLYVVLAAGALALAIALGRADRRVAAAGAGLALLLPWAFWNAYTLRGDYTRENRILTLAAVVWICLGLLAAGGVVWALQRWRLRNTGAHHRPRPDVLTALGRARVPVGIGISALAAALLLAFWYRGPHRGFDIRVGAIARTYDEVNLRWLALFITVPGLVVMWLGLVVATVRRSKPALFLLLLPGGILLPLYVWEAHVSMRMMWWGRRFVPAVIPAVMLLMALALGWAVAHRIWVLKVAGSAAATALVIAFAGQSLPLRHHQEMDGGWRMAQAISRPSGAEQGVYLYTWTVDIYDPMRNTPVFVWWAFDEVVANLPDDFDMATIEAYRQAFPDQPVFLVLHEDAVPNWLPPERFQLVGVVKDHLTFLEEWPMGPPPEDEPARRPEDEVELPERLTIWQLV